MNIFDEPFFQHKINPILLETLTSYWTALKEAKVSDEEKMQVDEALYNLVRFGFRKLSESLYLKYFAPISGSLFLLSAVHSDGIGDYMTTLKCAKLLKESFPALEIHVVYTHKQILPEIDPTDYHLKRENIHPFLETEDPESQILAPVLEGHAPCTTFSLDRLLDQEVTEKTMLLKEYEELKTAHPEAALALHELSIELEKNIQQLSYRKKKREEAEHLYEQMKESLAIVHVALALNTFDNPELAKKSFYFAETGNFQGIANYLQRNWYSMGLDAFEEGIFVKKPSLAYPWKAKHLAQLLWGSVDPSKDQVQGYLKSHILQLGYLPRVPEQREVFIQMVCKHHSNSHRHFDIILPVTQDSLLQFDEEWMRENSISKIIRVKFEPTANEEVIKFIDLPVQRELRLIEALPLPRSDFLKLIQLSDEVVGCTGDGSLSDCIAFGKIPFYEVRRHKRRMLDAFRHIAIKLTLPDVLTYFEHLDQFVSWPATSFVDKFEKLLYDPAFKEQWQTLVHFVQSFYNFEDAFISHLNRHFFITLSHEIKEKEDLIVQNYFQGTLSLENAYEDLERILATRA